MIVRCLWKLLCIYSSSPLVDRFLLGKRKGFVNETSITTRFRPIALGGWLCAPDTEWPHDKQSLTVPSRVAPAHIQASSGGLDFGRKEVRESARGSAGSSNTSTIFDPQRPTVVTHFWQYAVLRALRACELCVVCLCVVCVAVSMFPFPLSCVTCTLVVA